jgi:hypothetical protein
VGKDPVDHRGHRDEGDDTHLLAAVGTAQRVDLEDPA